MSSKPQRLRQCPLLPLLLLLPAFFFLLSSSWQFPLAFLHNNPRIYSLSLSLSAACITCTGAYDFAGANFQSSAKKARTMTTQSSLKDAFSTYADYLNNLNEKRERVVKASRDITMNSKKVIFQVHRISNNNKEKVLEKAHNDLAAVMDQYIARLVKELQGSDFWKLRRAYSPGIQEYVEAATLCRFCKSGTLLNLEEMNASLSSLRDPSHEPLQINILDYILGLADLTGELMRLAIGRISDGELEFAQKICKFVREIHRELTLLVPHMDEPHDMKTKMETMLQSVVKIENACFSIHVRGSEYIPLLGSDAPSYSLMGVAEGIDL